MSGKSKQQQRKTPAPRRHGGVVLAYIHPGETSGYFTESMLTTVLASAGGQIPRVVNILQEWSSANVSASRNAVTQRFLDMGVGEWLLWVDADMKWAPADVARLLEVADPVERPVVGGLCFGMMTDRMWPTVYQWAELEEGLTTVRVGQFPADTVVRVAATGAAFLLIHRTVLERMAARGFSRAFPFFQETEHLGKPVGEDLTFCIRAGLLGIPVHVHTGVAIGHHKSTVLDLAGFLAQEAAPAALPADVGLVVPTRGDHPDTLAALIATSGLPPERVVVVTNGDTPPSVVPGATLVHDDGPLNIHRWWNTGIDLLVERGCTRVAVLNDDVVISPDTLPRMVHRLGASTLALLDGDGPSGHCWVLNVTHGVRPDESFRWYCGDLQLFADATRARGVVRVPDAWCLHLHPTEATEGDPGMAAIAAQDDALYDERHPAGSRFAFIRREA